MTPERLFHELLGLGLNWEVVDSRFERESGTIHLEVRETPKLWELVRCPKDTGLVFCCDHTETLTWRHLNVFQHRCEITCRNAQVVFDKFHVVMNVNKAVDQVRRAEVRLGGARGGRRCTRASGCGARTRRT